MKNKILRINGDDWIKKYHYDKLKESKIKIKIREGAKPPTNPENTLTVISYQETKLVKELLGDTKEFYGNEEFSTDNESESNKPIVKINETNYSYEYFIQAKDIARAFGYSTNYNVYISMENGKPILLDFGSIKIIIAPRVDDDTNCVEGEQ